MTTSGYQTPGSRGKAPALFLPISREKWGPPAGQAGQRGAAPQRWLPRRPPNGYAAPCRPWQVVPLGPPQVSTCKVVSRPAPGGGGPPPPLFLWPARCRSLVLGLGATLFRSRGYYGTHLRTLIWELSFAKMLFSIFFLENASQIGFRIPGVTAPRTYQRQRS